MRPTELLKIIEDNAAEVRAIDALKQLGYEQVTCPDCEDQRTFYDPAVDRHCHFCFKCGGHGYIWKPDPPDKLFAPGHGSPFKNFPERSEGR